MIKAVVKLAIVALVANAIWRIGSAYMSYYRFKDAVDELALHSKGKTVEELKDRVLELDLVGIHRSEDDIDLALQQRRHH